MIDVSIMSLEDLMERFRSDIEFDCHSFWIKFRQSEAKDEILKRCEKVDHKEVLREIANYLRQNPPNSQFEVDSAFGQLLFIIITRLGKQGTEPEIADIQGWLIWIDSYVS